MDHKKLQHEHREILKTLQRIKVLGLDSSDSQELLRQLSQILETHLIEEKQFYQLLRDVAGQESPQKVLIDFIEKDLEQTSQQALDFCRRYRHGGSGLEFTIRFTQLYQTLNERMKKEEEFLFPMYESLMAEA